MRVLESRGLLKRVSVPVSAELEVTEIATRLVREGGPAVLFENVDSAAYRLGCEPPRNDGARRDRVGSPS